MSYTGEKKILAVYLDSIEPILGETTSSLNITCDAIEVSNKTSAWKQFIPGMRGATINATLYADDNDPAQKHILSSITTGKTCDVLLTSLTTFGQSDGSEYYSAVCIVTSVGLTHTNGAICTREVTFQVAEDLYVDNRLIESVSATSMTNGEE